MRILALIPARGGSKGIPRKNIREIAGKPLIAWTIEAALGAIGIDEVVVTTDDEEIADVSREWGAQVPFLRPKELASDDTPGVDPVLHALAQLPEFGKVLLLQPTSPLRDSTHIEGLLDLADRRGAHSVVSVSEASSHPAWMYRMSKDSVLEPLEISPRATRRQDLQPCFTLNGAMYWADAQWLQEAKSLVSASTLGYPMNDESSIDIDTMLDWHIAEMLLEKRQSIR